MKIFASLNKKRNLNVRSRHERVLMNLVNNIMSHNFSYLNKQLIS
jgi:hypothetical protein